MNIGPTELIIVAVILVVPVFGIVTAVSAGSLPDWAFEGAGTSKTLWVVLPLIGIVACGIITIVSGVMWFATYKPRVDAQARGGGAPSPPPPGPWTPPSPR